MKLQEFTSRVENSRHYLGNLANIEHNVKILSRTVSPEDIQKSIDKLSGEYKMLFSDIIGCGIDTLEHLDNALEDDELLKIYHNIHSLQEDMSELEEWKVGETDPFSLQGYDDKIIGVQGQIRLLKAQVNNLT